MDVSTNVWTSAMIDELCHNKKFSLVVKHMKHAGFVCERKLNVNNAEYEAVPKKPKAIEFLVDGQKQRFPDDEVLEWSQKHNTARKATNNKKRKERVKVDPVLLETRREQGKKANKKSRAAKKEDGHFETSGLTEKQIHVRLYKQFIDCVIDKPDGKKPRWLGMHNGLMSSAPNQKKFGKLKDHQVNIFFEFAKQLQTIVETKFGGKDNFHGFEDKKWNIVVWFSAILEMAAVDKMESETDCWTSKLLRNNQDGRPYLQLHHDNKSNSIFVSGLSAILNPHQAKVVNGCIIEASHLCSNNKCYKIDHCIFESKTNNSRREDECLNRCQLLCKCEPKCLPVIDGKLVKCRIKNCQCIAVEVQNVALETPHNDEVNELKRQLEDERKAHEKTTQLLEAERKAHKKTKQLLDEANMELTKKANVKSSKSSTPHGKRDDFMDQITTTGGDDEDNFATPDNNFNLSKKNANVQTPRLLSPKERQQSLAGLLGTIRSKHKLEDSDGGVDKKKVKKEATVAPKSSPSVSHFSSSASVKKFNGAQSKRRS